MKNFLPEIPPILEPENRLAKGLVIAFSLMVMGLLFFALGFIYRELLLEIFVSQTPLNSIVHRDDYIEMWKASLRFDAKFAYLIIIPGLLFALVSMLGGGIYRYCCKLTTVYVAHMFGWFYLSNTANIHFISTTGHSFGSPEFEAFKSHPFEYIGKFWPVYPILSDILIGIVIGVIFVSLWFRMASIISRWSVWQGNQWTNLLIALMCFIGFMWTCSQTTLTSKNPLRAQEAMVSQHNIINTIVVGAPMSIYYDEQLRPLGYFKSEE